MQVSGLPLCNNQVFPDYPTRGRVATLSLSSRHVSGCVIGRGERVVVTVASICARRVSRDQSIRYGRESCLRRFRQLLVITAGYGLVRG